MITIFFKLVLRAAVVALLGLAISRIAKDVIGAGSSIGDGAIVIIAISAVSHSLRAWKITLLIFAGAIYPIALVVIGVAGVIIVVVNCWASSNG